MTSFGHVTSNEDVEQMIKVVDSDGELFLLKSKFGGCCSCSHHMPIVTPQIQYLNLNLEEKLQKVVFGVTVTLYRLMVIKKPFVYHVFMRVLCIIVTLWLYEYPVET